MTGDARTLAEARRRLRATANEEIAAFLQRFFRTGPGGYGEGDRFLGVRVPVVRRIARECRALRHADVVRLLRSQWHEERLLALVILADRYGRADPDERERIFRTYLAHTHRINNWDLVDVSAPHIVGAHLDPRDLTLLTRLARSASVWERRIAILATFHWIRKGDIEPTLRIARLLVGDPHDLIHKAVGWMVREAAKRDRDAVEAFLRRHHAGMPRTMLRYAVERFPPALRRKFVPSRSAA
jgi:Predicted DNA alkylation repair enzyme